MNQRILVIQIPCYNEETALPVTLAALPAQVPGYDAVEVLVIDDGSTDATVSTAEALGVRHIVSHGRNRGLAQAFMTGIEHALKLGTHTIVNIDADNQYMAGDIAKLTAPVAAGLAPVVIGTRPIAAIARFSPAKRMLQRIGSWAVRVLSGTSVEDAPSGFRAIHRDVAQRLVIYSGYTYTIEMIVQLGLKKIPILCVPVRVNEQDLRPSRLMRSNTHYILRSLETMFRLFVLYRPIALFSVIAAIFGAAGVLLASRYLHFMLIGEGGGHVQSLLLAIVLTVSAFSSLLAGFICDSIRVNRMLLEDMRYRMIRQEGASAR